MSIWDVISGASQAIDLPGSMLRDLAVLRNPFDQWLTPFSGENRASGRDVLETWSRPFGGGIGPNQPGLDAGDVGGLALEMLLDPVNLIAGVGAGYKGYRALKAARDAKNVFKTGQVLRTPATHVLNATPTGRTALSGLSDKQIVAALAGPRDEASHLLMARYLNRPLSVTRPPRELHHAYSRRAPFTFFEVPNEYIGQAFRHSPRMPAMGGWVEPSRYDLAFLARNRSETIKQAWESMIPGHEATHLWQAQQPQQWRQMYSPGSATTLPAEVIKEAGKDYYGTTDAFLRDAAAPMREYADWPTAVQEAGARMMEGAIEEGFNAASWRDPLRAYLNQAGLSKPEAASILGERLRMRWPSRDWGAQPGIAESVAKQFADFLDSTTTPPAIMYDPDLLYREAKPLANMFLQSAAPEMAATRRRRPTPAMLAALGWNAAQIRQMMEQ